MTVNGETCENRSAKVFPLSSLTVLFGRPIPGIGSLWLPEIEEIISLFSPLFRFQNPSKEQMMCRSLSPAHFF